MSFNRCNYDSCQYKQHISESIGPGHYMINTPPISCEPCYPFAPSTRLQKMGASVDTSKYLIDIDSELINITRPYSKCPSKKWISNCPKCNCVSGEPCGQGVSSSCKKCQTKNCEVVENESSEHYLKNGERCSDSFTKNLKHWKDCSIPAEETRTSNPPCNLRGTGWNRFEWLCQDPQERVEIPFDYNIDNRILVKDNHRPCVATPINPFSSLPTQKQLECPITESVCGNFTTPSSVNWRNCNQINNY